MIDILVSRPSTVHESSFHYKYNILFSLDKIYQYTCYIFFIYILLQWSLHTLVSLHVSITFSEAHVVTVHNIALAFGLHHWAVCCRLVWYSSCKSCPLHFWGKKVEKVKCTLVQALRLRTGCTTHRGNRGIALPFLNQGTRRGWGVSVMPQPLFTPGKTRCLLYRRLGGPQGWSGQVRKISPQPGFAPRTIQLVASHYTDYATWPTYIFEALQLNG